MLKNINWTAVLKGLAWLLCLACTGLLMSFIEVKKKMITCKEIEILIPGADNFIEIEEIDAILKQSQGDLIGRNLKQLNLHEIEKNIAANPYIGFVKVYADMNGTVYVEIKQRQPILRIVNAGGQDYYVDSNGLKMPVSPNFTANVIVATGFILEGFNGRVDTLMTFLGKDLYQTARFLNTDSLWEAQIEQLYINEKNDIEMIPRVGKQRIIIGNAQGIETKMKNLLAFYKQAMPKVGWNTYHTINLKFLNQVVAERRDSSAVKRLDKPKVLDTLMQQKTIVSAMVKASIQEEVKKAMAQPEQKNDAKPSLPSTEVKTESKNAVTSDRSKEVVPVKAEPKQATPKTKPVIVKKKEAVSADKDKKATVQVEQKKR